MNTEREVVFEGYQGLHDKFYDAEGEEADVRSFGGGWIRSPRYRPRVQPAPGDEDGA